MRTSIKAILICHIMGYIIASSNGGIHEILEETIPMAIIEAMHQGFKQPTPHDIIKEAVMRKKKHMGYKFDSTKGYPGEGPPNVVNIEMGEEIKVCSFNIQGASTKKCLAKYTLLLDYAMHKNHKYDIVMIQETKSTSITHILDHIKKDPKFYKVRVEEAINTTNSRKGGVAFLILNPKLEYSNVKKGDEDWTSFLNTQEEKDEIPNDNILGKWIIIN